MPASYLRRLTGRHRDEKSDLHLARYLAFIAGATNAGGFLAVQQYTSHMTGIVSRMADSVALRDTDAVLSAMGALLSFIAGAACSAILINWGRRRASQAEYALPLLMESTLLLVFGLLGGNLEHHEWIFVPTSVMLLCFIMGLQNAIITKLSRSTIRTTHVTGMVTDIGIELGKMLYWNRQKDVPDTSQVRGDRHRLWILVSLVSLFFIGGVCGAVEFKRIGFSATLFLSAALLLLAFVPVTDELQAMLFSKKK